MLMLSPGYFMSLADAGGTSFSWGFHHIPLIKAVGTLLHKESVDYPMRVYLLLLLLLL